MKKLFVLLLALAVSDIANAGIHGLTHHSRANCAGFNETVSWHRGHEYWLWVVGRHRSGKEDHQVIQGWDLTWRQAPLHFPEGRGGWSVEGHHWMKDNAGRPVEVANEVVYDCSIYDGWWD